MELSTVNCADKNDPLTNFIKDNKKIRHESWNGSKYEEWGAMSPNKKGSSGVECIKHFLEKNGYDTKKVNKEGDILFKHKHESLWTKAEVKTSCVTLKNEKNGTISEGLWFNQIRLNQKGWTHLFLVGVYPDHYTIYDKSRVELEKNRTTMESITGALAHVGMDTSSEKNFIAVSLNKTIERNTFNEWKNVYSSNK